MKKRIEDMTKLDLLIDELVGVPEPAERPLWTCSACGKKFRPSASRFRRGESRCNSCRPKGNVRGQQKRYYERRKRKLDHGQR